LYFRLTEEKKKISKQETEDVKSKEIKNLKRTTIEES